jgi:hypothetical protein
MKKATPKRSPNHHTSGKYNKPHTSNKTDSNADTSKVDMSHHDQVSYAAMMSRTCDIAVFDEQSLLWTLQTGQSLEQHQVIYCPASHMHKIDIAPLIKNLRKDGHSIVSQQKISHEDFPSLEKGKKIHITHIYSYIDTIGSAAND